MPAVGKQRRLESCANRNSGERRSRRLGTPCQWCTNTQDAAGRPQRSRGALGAAMLSVVSGRRLGRRGAPLMPGVHAASKMAHTKRTLSTNSFLPFFLKASSSVEGHQLVKAVLRQVSPKCRGQDGGSGGAGSGETWAPGRLLCRVSV